MDQAKIHCGKCKDCTPKRQKEVQGEMWTPSGKTPGFSDRTNLRSKDGKMRSCPTWAVTDPHPIRHEDPKEEEPEEDEDDGSWVVDDGSWVVDEGYGPHCETCGASRGEDHCATCPNHKLGPVPTTF